MPFYDVYSSAYLVTFFVFALVETLLCSGITYGWASIVVVFKQEYFYMDLCVDFFKHINKSLPTPPPQKLMAVYRNTTIVGGGAGFYNDGMLPGCPAQDARLNLIFTVSLFCLCGIKFPAGVFIDKYGPRIGRIVGGMLYLIATVGLGFVAIGYENLLFPIFAFIAMGGSLLVVSVYQVSNIVFRKSRSRIICILHGAFDSSAVFLLVFKLTYENGVEFKYIMYGYSAICFVFIAVGTFVLIPPVKVLFHWCDEENEIVGNNAKRAIAGPDFVVNSYSRSLANVSVRYGTIQSAEKDFHLISEEEYDPLDGEVDGDEHRVNKDNEVLVKPAVKHIKKKSRFAKGSVLRSIFSPLYLMELIYLLTFQLKLWYFVGSLPDFLERIGKNDEKIVSHYINLFGYIQFGGIFITPVIGFVFDRDELTGEKETRMSETQLRLKKLRTCILPFGLTNVLCIAFCALSFIENLKVQIVSFILYTTVRGFLYANHGAYMGAAFPASQFGTLYGLGIFIGGTFGVLQYALFELTSGPLNGNPFWTNMILLILVIVGNIHPIYLWWYCRSEGKRLAMKRANK